MRDDNEDDVTAIRCDHTDCSVSNYYRMVLSFSDIDSSAITSSQYTGFRLHLSFCQHEDRHIIIRSQVTKHTIDE